MTIYVLTVWHGSRQSVYKSYGSLPGDIQHQTVGSEIAITWSKISTTREYTQF
jgi:hypothetical protein